MEVIIDGVRYAPATNSAPSVADVLRVLAAQFWGDGPHDIPDDGMDCLRIIVTDDSESAQGETFEDFAARLGQALA